MIFHIRVMKDPETVAFFFKLPYVNNESDTSGLQ
jgi:hypothetical protein